MRMPAEEMLKVHSPAVTRQDEIETRYVERC